MTNVIDINRQKTYASGVIQAINNETPTPTYRGIVIVSRTISDWFRSQACGAYVEEVGHNNAVVTLYPCDVNSDGSAKQLSLWRYLRAKYKREAWQTDSHRARMDLDAVLSYAGKLLGGNITFRVSRSIPRHVLPHTTASAVDSMVDKQRKYWKDAGL